MLANVMMLSRRRILLEKTSPRFCSFAVIAQGLFVRAVVRDVKWGYVGLWLAISVGLLVASVSGMICSDIEYGK